MSQRVADGATVVVALAAMTVAGLNISDRFTRSSGPTGSGREDRSIENWRELALEGHAMGPANAPVIIIEFGDYECPFCRRAEGPLRALRAAYPDEVRLIYRHLPLESHANAYGAARLAECGAEQERFPEVHSMLYDAVTLSGLDPAAVATEAGVPDIGRFVECAASTRFDARIDMDIDVAHSLEIHRVPSIIVDGVLQGVPPDSARLFSMVEELLATK